MTDSPQAQPPKVPEAPEKIWINGAELRSAKRTGVGSFYIEKNDTANSRDIEYVRADLPRAAADEAGLILSEEEVRILTDHHYYKAEKAITRRGDHASQQQHLERLATIRTWAKSRAEREGERT
jgi:hypothetical protein